MVPWPSLGCLLELKLRRLLELSRPELELELELTLELLELGRLGFSLEFPELELELLLELLGLSPEMAFSLTLIATCRGGVVRAPPSPE